MATFEARPNAPAPRSGGNSPESARLTIGLPNAQYSESGSSLSLIHI